MQIQLDSDTTAEQVVAYELGNYRASIYKTSDGRWLVVNTLTEKCLECICFQHASEILDGCVKQLKTPMA